MDSPHPIGIIGTGSYLPGPAAGGEGVYHIAAAAAEQALSQAGLTPHRLSDVVVASSLPGHPLTATADTVRRLVGADRAVSLDVNVVYGGFGYALAMAERILRDEPDGAHAVVVGTASRPPFPGDPDPAATAELGEAAGAVVLGRVPPGRGMVTTSLLTRSDLHRLMPEGARTHRESTFGRLHVRAAVDELLSRAGVAPHEVRHFVSQQAYGVTSAGLQPVLGLPSASVHLACERHENASAASIPLTLDRMHRWGLLAEDDVIVLCGFGVGMSVGCALLRWAATRHAGPLRTHDRPRELVVAC